MDKDAERFYIVDGVQYRTFGWFGSQIQSIEWKRPQITFDNHREILGYKFVPVHTDRKGLKWRISWCLKEVQRNNTTDEQNALIREFYQKLRNP